MRAHEFITEDQKRTPEISLRRLNHLKHINRARAASHARQAALKRTMYAGPAREYERIELKKARRVLEQGALAAVIYTGTWSGHGGGPHSEAE